jgi:hypothetical protein
MNLTKLLSTRITIQDRNRLVSIVIITSTNNFYCMFRGINRDCLPSTADIVNVSYGGEKGAG